MSPLGPLSPCFIGSWTYRHHLPSMYKTSKVPYVQINHMHKCLGPLLTFRQGWNFSTNLRSWRLHTKANTGGRTFQGRLACQLLSMQLSSLLLLLLILKATHLVSEQNLHFITTPSCSMLFCINKCFFYTMEDFTVDDFMSKYLLQYLKKQKVKYCVSMIISIK